MFNRHLYEVLRFIAVAVYIVALAVVSVHALIRAGECVGDERLAAALPHHQPQRLLVLADRVHYMISSFMFFD